MPDSLTGPTLLLIQGVNYAQARSVKAASLRPTHQRVTLTVRPLLIGHGFAFTNHMNILEET
jgi:hypothetical protein